MQGCSSLGGGWLSETGQYWPTEDGSLEANPYAWRSLASVVYLESPAFVGYSYSNTSSDAVVGDARAAADARSFLLGFLDRFPGLRGADLYIAGESYAGHYIPQLAEAILAGNAGPQAGGARTINLRGVAIGNPWTDPASDNAGAAVHWYSHYHIRFEAEGRGGSSPCL